MIVEVELETLTTKYSDDDYRYRETVELEQVFRTEIKDGCFVVHFYGNDTKKLFPLSRIIHVTEWTSD